nr:putative reverse transcriptase domain-containing protein [Tanacetum cinerariifolium]
MVFRMRTKSPNHSPFTTSSTLATTSSPSTPSTTLGFDFVSPPDSGDGVVRFVLYDLIKPRVPSCSEQLNHGEDLLHDQQGVTSLQDQELEEISLLRLPISLPLKVTTLLILPAISRERKWLPSSLTYDLRDSLFSKGLRTVKPIPPKCRLGFSRVLKGALDKLICKPDDMSCWVSLLVLPLCLLKTVVPRSNLECKSAIKRQHQEQSIANAIQSWSVPGGSLQLHCKRKVYDGHYISFIVLSSSCVAPYNDDTLEDFKTKHAFKRAPSLPHISIDHHHLIASSTVVLDKIKCFPRGTSCGRDGLRAKHLMDCLSGADVATSNELVSSITQVANLFLDGNCPTRKQG